MNTKITKSTHCISCGDPIRGACDGDPPGCQDQMRVRCPECALEVLGIEIPFVGTLQHASGGGRRVIRDTKTH